MTTISSADTHSRTLTLADWQAEGKRRFGSDRMAWRFVCPSCGHVAPASDWRDAKAPENAIAFSCVGRWKGGDDNRTFKRSGGPCMYSGGGLFRLNPVRVVFPDGLQHHVFEFADHTLAARAAGGKRY